MVRLSMALVAIGFLALKVDFALSQGQYIEWIVDPRCPDDDRRALLEHSNSKGPNNLRKSPQDANSNSNIGDLADKVDNEAEHRTLQSLSTNPDTFNLKIYWQAGYCWQREWIERRWCLECPGKSCSTESFLWINECDADNSLQRFEWVQLGLDGFSYENQGLLKTANYDLCVEQVEAGTFRLLPCDETNVYQKLVGFTENRPFELRPAHSSHSQNCLTQNHHPKPYEELISQPCYMAEEHTTSYWVVDSTPSENALSLRVPTCSASLPCGLCEGDCRDDSDCRGSLRCFQRGSGNSGQSVPGCSGTAITQCKCEPSHFMLLPGAVVRISTLHLLSSYTPRRRLLL